MILVDTPIWSPTLRRRRRDLGQHEGRDVAEWERLVRVGRAALIGSIRQELLPGVRDERWTCNRIAQGARALAEPGAFTESVVENTAIRLAGVH